MQKNPASAPEELSSAAAAACSTHPGIVDCTRALATEMPGPQHSILELTKATKTEPVRVDFRLKNISRTSLHPITGPAQRTPANEEMNPSSPTDSIHMHSRSIAQACVYMYMPALYYSQQWCKAAGS